MASDAEVPQDATKEDVLILRLPPALAEGVRERCWREAPRGWRT